MEPSTRIATLTARMTPASVGWSAVLRRAAAATALSSLFGVALGARAGGLETLAHAALSPIVVVGAFAVGAPPLYVAVALADAPVDVLELSRALARGAGTAALLLAGFSPLIALFSVSGESIVAGAAAGWAALAFSLLLGLAVFRAELRERSPGQRALGGAALAYSAFVAVLALRLAWVALPALGGAR